MASRRGHGQQRGTHPPYDRQQSPTLRRLLPRSSDSAPAFSDSNNASAIPHQGQSETSDTPPSQATSGYTVSPLYSGNYAYPGQSSMLLAECPDSGFGFGESGEYWYPYIAHSASLTGGTYPLNDQYSQHTHDPSQYGAPYGGQAMSYDMGSIDMLDPSVAIGGGSNGIGSGMPAGYSSMGRAVQSGPNPTDMHSQPDPQRLPDQPPPCAHATIRGQAPSGTNTETISCPSCRWTAMVSDFEGYWRRDCASSGLKSSRFPHAWSVKSLGESEFNFRVYLECTRAGCHAKCHGDVSGLIPQ